MPLPYATIKQVEKIAEEKASSVGVTNEGTALKVSKIDTSLPKAIATFDGVDYYHKQEFDISVYNFGYHDLLTGKDTSDATKSRLYGTNWGQVVYVIYLYYPDFYFQIVGPNPDYTSRAFTVVKTLEEVTDNTKICLPGCVAYYGWLSEDKNTFISYYNLESDIDITINKVTDGENTVPVRDSRLPSTESKDEGKILRVNEEGNISLAAPPEAGTKLYRHSLTLSGITWSGANGVYIITNDPSELTNIEPAFALSYLIYGPVEGGESFSYDIVGTNLIRKAGGSSSPIEVSVKNDSVTPL